MKSKLRMVETQTRPTRRATAAREAGPARPHAELGLCQWFHYRDHATVERAVHTLHELGVRHLRTGVSWADFYRDDGPRWYDWLFHQLRDFELLISVWHTPPSIGEAPACNAPPVRLEEYTEVIERIIGRYGRYFDHLELWNEPNNLYKWDFRRFDPHWSKFAEMVRLASRYARDRGKFTVLGGMSPVDPGWLALIDHHRGLEAMDAVAIHGFPHMWWNNAPCWDQPDNWHGWRHRVHRVRLVAAPLRLWITEAGLATWDLHHAREGRHALQVRMLEQAAAAPADRVYWYSLFDLDPQREAIEGYHVDENEYHLGLVRHDGSRKDAFWRMQQLLAEQRERQTLTEQQWGDSQMVANQSRTTTDHDEIRRWVEQRRGKPARVRGTGGVDDPGMLRIDMPDAEADEDLEPIDWNTFFDKFEREGLAMVYQEETGEGHTSRFSKFVKR